MAIRTRSFATEMKTGGGDLALFALMLGTWLLILLAWSGTFQLWVVALPLLVVALFAAVGGWWRIGGQTAWPDRLAILLLIGAGLFLFTPPAEHLPLTGDSAIYPNEAAFLARTGGLTATYEPLALLPPESRTLFYVSNEEQFSTITLEAYQGLLYGGYYVTERDGPTIQTSRMSLSTVWLALLYQLAAWLPATSVPGVFVPGVFVPGVFVPGVSVPGAMGMALYATGLFGALSLVLLYLVARHFFRWPIALWVALLLAVSFPQIHFSRAPYAEITGQFWTLAGLLYGLRWIETRAPWLLGMAFACWVTTWAGRIDALLLLGPAGVLLLYVAVARDRKSLRTLLLLLPLLLVGIWISTNGPYVGATYELLLSRWPWFGGLLVALLVVLVAAVALMWVAGHPILRGLRRVAPALHLLLFGGFAFIILWATVPNPLRQAGVTRNFQEIIWFSSQVMTPGVYWLALAGVGWLLWHTYQHYRGGFASKEVWLLTTFLLLATAFFYSYTSAAVYPASLRRLISDVIPLLMLMAGFGLAVPWPHRPMLPGWSAIQGVVRGVVAVALLAWMLALSRPLLQEREGVGTLAFLEELHIALPAESVIFFEQQDGDSWVGWLAAPLYSLYGDRTLLLDSDTPDPALLATAAGTVIEQGLPLYIATQQETLPAPLLPPGYTATLERQLVWQSTLIGHAPTPYPLPIWHFAHPLYLYRVAGK